MLSGIYAARNLVGGDYDVWSVNTEQEYHEEGAAEDVVAAPSDRLIPMPLSPTDGPIITPEEILDAAFARIDPVALGAAFGSVASLGIFLATTILLVKGGPHVGRNLSLLAHYLQGFRVSVTGSLLGALEVGALGAGLGYVAATLRNQGLAAYAWLLRIPSQPQPSRRGDEVNK